MTIPIDGIPYQSCPFGTKDYESDFEGKGPMGNDWFMQDTTDTTLPDTVNCETLEEGGKTTVCCLQGEGDDAQTVCYEEGIACDDDEQCGPGMFCADWWDGDDKCHDGSDGDICNEDNVCKDSFVCNDYYDQCKPVGQEPDECDMNNDCAPGLYCASWWDGDDKCHDGSDGDICQEDQNCQVNLVCNDYFEKCKPAGLEGDYCYYNNDCTDGFYCANFYLGDDKCHDGDDGDPCNVDAVCQWGLVCNDYFENCKPIGLEGDFCSYNNDCTDGMYCAGWGNGDDKCHDGSDGDICYDNANCQFGLLCNDYFDKCKPPGTENSYCGYNNDCVDGLYCANWWGGDDRCHDGSTGDPCQNGSDCLPGLSCVGPDDTCA